MSDLASGHSHAHNEEEGWKLWIQPRHPHKISQANHYVVTTGTNVKIVGSYVELVKVVRLELVINYSYLITKLELVAWLEVS
jgi:hypothetical protein